MTSDSLLDALGGTSAVAKALSVPLTVVSNWRSRGIPAMRWPAIVRLAGVRKVRGVTSETLASMHARRSGARSRDAEARA